MSLSQDYGDNQLSELWHNRSTHKLGLVVLRDIWPEQMECCTSDIEGDSLSGSYQLSDADAEANGPILQANAVIRLFPFWPFTHNGIALARASSHVAWSNLLGLL